MKITIGKSRYDKDWKVYDVTWEQLRGRLSQPVRTAETVAEFQKLPKEEKGKLKDVGGFVGGPMVRNGERKNDSIHSRYFATIDVDGGKATPDVAKVKAACESLGCWYAMHSTHSSYPDAPRLRVVIPLDREVSEEEYTPIALRICETIGMDVVDPTTCQKARIMYWPSCSKDAAFVFETGGKSPLSADKVLSSYIDWKDATEWPGATQGAIRAQKRRHITGSLTNGRVQDPAQKEGWVGAFCRRYSIDDAIATFSLPYTRYGHDRYSYANGSTKGGAVVYDGGRFLYSNHGTDPASGQLCNAFDLVRIHLFGDDDELGVSDTPMPKRASYKAMIDQCEQMDDVRAEHAKLIVGAFADAPDTTPAPVAKNAAISPVEDVDALLGLTGQEENKEPPTGSNGGSAGSNGGSAGQNAPEDEGWMSRLDANKKNLLPTTNNFDLIFDHDPKLRDVFRFDLFAGRRLVKRALPWDRPDQTFPRELTDSDLAEFQLYFSRQWKINGGKDALTAVMDVQLNKDRVHPVRQWFSSLPEWDGVERVDSVFIRYLGAPDTALNRMVSRKHLTAAVKRVFEPGCKYDQVLVLVGPEGTGKSSIIEKLANGWYMDSNIPVGDKDAYQNLVGHWLIEMSELADYEAKSIAAYKNFISSMVDRYRPPYGRETISVPRQCVFFGTTNENGFLKGYTGNRRFWVMDCPGDPEMVEGIFDGTLEAELSQLWAEALYYYHNGESLVLNETLSEMMRIAQKGHEGVLISDNTPMIRQYVMMPKPNNWLSLSIDQKQRWYQGKIIGETVLDEPVAEDYYQQFICVKEVAMVVYGQKLTSKSRYEDKELRYIFQNVPWLKTTMTNQRFGIFGSQRAYEIIRDVDDVTTES